MTDFYYDGPERRREDRLVTMDKLKVQVGLVTQALLHPLEYTQVERERLAAHLNVLMDEAGIL